MLDHVFTDAISALRDAFESAYLERQPFDEHFQSDVLVGDLTWETSYGLPGEGEPPRIVAHVTMNWPAWEPVGAERVYPSVPDHSPSIGDDRLERVGLTTEISHPDPGDPLDLTPEYAVEITYEGLYELAEETVADGRSTLLDDHFGALGGWIAAILVKLGDLGLSFLPAE